MALTDRLYGLLLRVWPSPARDAVGDEMRATFAARLRARRAAGRPTTGFMVREMAAVVTSGVRMRLRPRRGRVGRKGSAIVMEPLFQDVRIALRGFARTPGFALTVIAVLALGIGANTAIFSVLNAALLRPLPAHDPGRLVTIRESNPEKAWEAVVAAPANMLDWREQVAAFEDVAGWLSPGSLTMTGEGEPELVRNASVTGNFFDVLGVRAAQGRMLRDEETWTTAPRVVVLSDAFWTRRFGRDPGVIGRTITLNGNPHEVIGIAPPGFTFPAQGLDTWISIRFNREDREQIWFRRAHFVDVVARLKPDVSMAQADAELQMVVRRLQEQYPETNRVMGAVMFPLQRFLTADYRTPLLLLQGAVLLLLLVACANVGNLLLVRAAGRRREMAVRATLGAGRARIAAVVLAESLTLAIAGGATGIALGRVGHGALRSLMPPGLPADIGLDLRVLVFAAVLTLGAGVVFGLAPALRGPGRIQDVLREGGRTGSAGRRTLRTSDLLVTAETALALVLVLAAGLLVRSFAALRDVDPGFRVEDRVSARVSLPAADYDTPEKVNAFFDALNSRLASVPGTHAVGFSRTLPLAGSSYTSDFTVRDWTVGRFGVEVTHESVSPESFEALGMTLVRGRGIEDTDRADTENVLVVNEAFGRQNFAGEDPIGRYVAFERVPTDETTWWRIVGVVADTRQTGLADPPITQVFKPYRQDPTQSMAVVVHADRPAADVVAEMRAAVRELDPDIALAAVSTLEEVYARSLRADRFLLLLLAGFAGLALLLACIGVYGVASQAARRRTQEIGIRVALGARRADVLRLILVRAATPVGLGIVLGLAGGLAATRLLARVLFGVAPFDPPTVVTVALILAVTAGLAILLPARMAARADPARALRVE